MKRIVIAAACGLMSLAVAQAATIQWNIDNVTSLATTVPPSSGTPILNLAVSDLSRVNGGGGTLVNNSVPSSGYTGASGNNNVQASAVLGTLNTATSTYFTFTLTPSNGGTVALTGLSFGSRSTATGPTTLTIFSSLDNYTVPIGTATSPTDSSWNLYNPTLLPTVSGIDTAITYRIYGSGGTATASNWRLDDITATYTLAIIPEPTTFALLGASGLLVCVNRIRRRRS